MGAPKVKAPAPTAAEQKLQKQQAALLAEQTKILQQQQKNQAILMPFLAEQYGVKINFDDEGNIAGFEDLDPEGKARRDEIQRLQEERSLAALKGELPVDPVLERTLESQEQTLRERLAAQFGPGYETSSAGIQTLDEFFRSAEGLRYGARTGQMTLAEQLALARQNSNMATGANLSGQLTQLTLGNQLGLAGAYGQNAQGYGAALQPYQFNRQMQFNASSQNAQLKQQWLSGIGELAGVAMFAPMEGTAAASLFSDRTLKENISKIGDTYWGPGIYIYTLKGDDTYRIGMMADEVMKYRPDAIGERDGYLTVRYGAL